MNNEIKCIITDLSASDKIYDYCKNNFKEINSILICYYSYYLCDNIDLKSFVILYDKFNNRLKYEIINNEDLSVYSFYSVDSFILNLNRIPTYEPKKLVYE
jgi:hypothetical protein